MAPSPEASVVVQQASPERAADALVSLPALWRALPARWRAVPARWRGVVAFLGHLAPVPAAGLIYELLRGLFHYRGTVHVGDLFELEARLFSVATADGPRALSDVVSRHTSPWLDVLSGATYF